MSDLNSFLLKIPKRYHKRTEREWHRTSYEVFFLLFICFPLSMYALYIESWLGAAIGLCWMVSVLICHLLWRKDVIKEIEEKVKPNEY